MKLNRIDWNIMSKVWEAYENMGVSPKRLDRVLRYLESPILVMGSGMGLVSECLINKGYTVDSIDSSSEMIKRSREKRNIASILCNSEKTPFPDKSYKTILINSGVIDSVSLYAGDTQKILEECMRLIRNDGKVIISYFKEEPHMEFIYNSLKLNRYPSNYSLFLVDDLKKVRSKFETDTKMRKDLIDFIFSTYPKSIKYLYTLVNNIKETLLTKNIAPKRFISKHIGYNKYNLNNIEEKYLIHIIKNSFNIVKKEKLSDNQTQILIGSTKKV